MNLRFCLNQPQLGLAPRRVKEDTILGIVFSGMFAMGIVIYLKIETDVHLDHILYGNMLGITWGEVRDILLIGLVSVGFLMAKRHDLLAYSFDAQHAQAIGLPTKLLHYGLLSVISLTVVGALTAVGLILAIAFLISPGAIAFLITRKFSHMLVVATLVGAGSSLVGIYASFFLDSAPAPTIVLVMTLVFIVTFIVTILRRKNAEALATV